jgi:hypothetical protein
MGRKLEIRYWILIVAIEAEEQKQLTGLHLLVFAFKLLGHVSRAFF